MGCGQMGHSPSYFSLPEYHICHFEQNLCSQLVSHYTHIRIYINTTSSINIRYTRGQFAASLAMIRALCPTNILYHRHYWKGHWKSSKIILLLGSDCTCWINDFYNSAFSAFKNACFFFFFFFKVSVIAFLMCPTPDTAHNCVNFSRWLLVPLRHVKVATFGEVKLFL